jgi:hypothetical protein
MVLNSNYLIHSSFQIVSTRHLITTIFLKSGRGVTGASNYRNHDLPKYGSGLLIVCLFLYPIFYAYKGEDNNTVKYLVIIV